jgi:hypothetical protein
MFRELINLILFKDINNVFVLLGEFDKFWSDWGFLLLVGLTWMAKA